MKPEIAVCFVTYNNQADIGLALAAVEARDALREIQVWDNASRDGTREAVRRFSAVQLHESAVNLGFCGGVNRLLGLTQTPYVLLLNPDTRLAPGCLTRLLSTLKNAPPDVAGVGPKLVKPATPGAPRCIDSAGMELNRLRLSPHDRGEGQVDRGQFDEPGESFGPSFACVLLRRAAIEALSVDGEFLDESYFAYYEDVDVAWRARRLGWRFLYEPRAVCEHRRGCPDRHGPTLAARAFVNRYLLWLANEDGRDGWAYLLSRIPYELARLSWKCLQTPGFSVAWRMLAADWRRVLRKRRLIAQMAVDRR